MMLVSVKFIHSKQTISGRQYSDTYQVVGLLDNENLVSGEYEVTQEQQKKQVWFKRVQPPMTSGGWIRMVHLDVGSFAAT